MHAQKGGKAPTLSQSDTRRLWMVSTTPRLFYPQERPGTLVQNAGCALGSVWTVTENVAPTRI
jgi:hypothetical protein